jgi:hypothetical protein
MEVLDIPVKAKTRYSATARKQLYAVEDVFDKIDKQFVDFYGEYGQKMVNARREEWRKEGFVNLPML